MRQPLIAPTVTAALSICHIHAYMKFFMQCLCVQDYPYSDIMKGQCSDLER